MLFWSGRRDSNPQLSAWKADALAIELLPQIRGGERRIRTFVGVRRQIYSLLPLAARASHHIDPQNQYRSNAVADPNMKQDVFTDTTI